MEGIEIKQNQITIVLFITILTLTPIVGLAMIDRSMAYTETFVQNYQLDISNIADEVARENSEDPVLEAEEKIKVPPKESECLKCHEQVLKEHDVLGVGAGSSACWSCHRYTNVEGTSIEWEKHGSLQLINGTLVLKTDDSKLCGSCHQRSYNNWENEIHGKPGEKLNCNTCHNPHRPYISGIRNLPPPTANPPPPPPTIPLAIFTIIILTMIVTIIVLIKKERRKNF